MEIFGFIKEFCSVPAVSGNEKEAAIYLKNNFSQYFDETVSIGNHGVIFRKKPHTPGGKKILIDAHIDRIGFIVKDIKENGFIECVPSGGFDPSVVPGNLFTVHGKEKITAVSTIKPTHLLSKEESSKKPDLSSVFFDTAVKDSAALSSLAEPGDPVTFRSEAFCIGEKKIASAGLDNAVSVAASLISAEMIKETDNDLYFSFSGGEETTSRGAISAASRIKPDMCFVLDAGFAFYNGLERADCILENNGPSVSYTDTLSRKLTELAISVTNENNIGYQLISEPGGTGTNATQIQIRNGGIPSCVLSIPIRYMHTPNETVVTDDIIKTADLLSALLKHNYESDRLL